MITRQGHIHTLRESSIFVQGQRLFNMIPKEIRNITNCKVEKLKAVLDKWLAGVPDEPQIQGYTQSRRAPTNSLLEMSQFHQDTTVDEPRPRPGCVSTLP